MNQFILHTIKQLQALRKRQDMSVPEKFEYSIRLRRRLRSLIDQIAGNSKSDSK